jgi:anti-anti-sigma factor
VTTPIQTNADIQSLLDGTLPELSVNVYPEGDSCVVHISGELDMATRNRLFSASTAGHHSTMVIDLAGVTFLDCSGYGSLVASRRIIEGDGRTLTVRGATGQPAHLFELIAALEGISPRGSTVHVPVGATHDPTYVGCWGA